LLDEIEISQQVHCLPDLRGEVFLDLQELAAGMS
jgi:hypothetical protein